MDLDRGTLVRIDRKLLAGLEQDEVFKMVRVPVSMAKWSMWKRYCDSAGIRWEERSWRSSIES